MALSQVQCLDDNNINLRTNESKAEFLYSEDQRLALETLIHAGQGAFEDYIKTNNIRCFLSDLELERILNTVEVYSPGSPENNNGEVYWEGDGEEISLQYWPDRSDRSIPQLDIGWPDPASYRGVTRAQVYTQPPYEGRSHIKEVVRKMIGQAQKVIAVVMDLFTDIDIFKDLLDASYRRKVAVYIMLETTGVKHFMKMCERAGIHTGHLKNLRVRCIRGAEFFSRSSKRLYGSQSQKFMFIDGDKAVSGSYSFTWSASRLDRNLITVLTGQAVDTFDTLFQDMYVLSNEVCLSKLNLSSEPEPEYLPQAVPTLLPSATKALKLINPKYTLVSNCAFTTNGPVTDLTSGKNSTSKNQTEIFKMTPVVPPVHPGLLNLEKANMINYIPTWPDPDPPSDVIGFINIRDANKPLQAHLMRSELFEVSQAIRFKAPVHDPEESLTLKACPGPISKTASHSEAQAQVDFNQNQHQISSPSEDLIMHLEKPETVHGLACNKVDKESLLSKNTHTEKDFSTAISSCSQDDTKQTQDNLRPLMCSNQTSLTVSDKTYLDESFAMPNKHFVKKSQVDQIITDVATQDHKDTKPGSNGTQISSCDSSVSSLSDEYFECFSPEADFRSVEDVFVSGKKPESLDSLIKNGHQEQADLGNNQSFFTPKLLQNSCSIIFNFLSAEFKTTADLSKTTFERESDKGVIINDSKQPVKDSEGFCFSQTPNGCVKFSSTSDEYFECSDTVSLKSEIEKINLNNPQGIPKPILEAEKLPELSCRNIKDKDEPKMHSEVEQPEFQHLLDMTADDLKVVLEPSQLDEKASRRVKDCEVTSEPVVESQSMSNVSHQYETRSSQQFLEIQTETVLVDLTEKMPIQDLQHEVSVDLACEKSEKESQRDASLRLNEIDSDFESKVSLDVVCEEQSAKSLQDLQVHDLILKQDLQPEVSLDLMVEKKPLPLVRKNSDLKSSESEGDSLKLQTEENPDIMLKPSDINLSLQLAEKIPTQDLQLEVSLDLACEESEKHLLQELQPDSSLKLISEEKLEKNSISDFEPKVSLDVVCEEQSAKSLQDLQVHDLVFKQDLQPEVSLDLMGEMKPLPLVRKNSDLKSSESEGDSLKLQTEVTPDIMLKPSDINGSLQLAEKIPTQDLQLEVSLDLACEESEKHLLQELQPDSSLKLISEEKLEKNSISDFEPKVSLDVVCEEQSAKSLQDLQVHDLLLKQDMQPEVSLDLIGEKKPLPLVRKNSDLKSSESEGDSLKLQTEVTPDIMLKPSDINGSLQLAEKIPTQDLQLEVSLDLACEESEKHLLHELQADSSLKLISEEKLEKNSISDFEPKVSLDVVCEEQSAKSLQDLQVHDLLLKQDMQPEVSLDLMGEMKPLPLVRKNSDLKSSESEGDSLKLQTEVNLGIMLKPSEVNVVSSSAKNSELNSSILQDIANVTSVISEKHEVTKSIELPKSEELEMSMTHIDSVSKCQPNLRSEEDVNDYRLQNGEVSPTVLKRNSEENNSQKKMPEQYESIELLILEESDLHSDPIRPPAVLSKETKMSKTEPVQPKTTNDGKLSELSHDVYNRNGRGKCYPTAPVEEKHEEEHICTNPINKNPKMERLAKKKSLQTSSRIPIQARRGSTKSPMIKPDTTSLSSGLQAPKAGMHKHPLGKAVGQNKTSITPPSSPEKLSTGGITPFRSTQIPQRPTPSSPTSPTKQPQVQLTAPRIRPLDQPNVSRKHSVSIAKYSCSSSGNSCPGKVKKQAVKGSLPSP